MDFVVRLVNKLVVLPQVHRHVSKRNLATVCTKSILDGDPHIFGIATRVIGIMDRRVDRNGQP